MRSRTVVVVVTLLAALLASSGVLARKNEGTTPATIHPIELAALPREARQTLQAIKRGGPFAFERDGGVFGNYERRLPPRGRGYYREYTVPTPGERQRGARRIVAGAHAEYYYSDDHYRTFKRIRE
jgi:ribonuclease T1